MATSKITTYIILFNVLMAIFLVLSSQVILYSIQQRRGEAVGQIGLTIDTYYTGPIELTPTHARNDILNLPLFVFIFTIAGNVILILHLRRENRRIHINESKVGR